jgi:hypothetical protein
MDYNSEASISTDALMLRNMCLAMLIVMGVAATSRAAVTISWTLAESPGLAGFKTWTLAANSTDPIIAMDFAGDGSNGPEGFLGTMNQISPAGLPTVFSDLNDLIPVVVPGANALQDSQFSVFSTQVVVRPQSAEEGPNSLQAAWAWSTPQGLTVPVAQIVTKANDIVSFRGVITALVNGVETDFPVSGSVGFFVDPSPPIVDDVNLGNRIRGTTIAHQFVASGGEEPITWGNLVVNGPGAPANAPTLTAGGAFSWNSVGTDPLGIYTFDVTATNPLGSSVGQLTINLVPEPATVSQVGLVSIVLMGLGTRPTSKNSCGIVTNQHD